MVVRGPGFSGKRDEKFYEGIRKHAANEIKLIFEIMDDMPNFKKKYSDILNDSTLSGFEQSEKIEERDSNELREEAKRFLEQQKKLEGNNE
jgi:hypothetical protein